MRFDFVADALDQPLAMGDFLRRQRRQRQATLMRDDLAVASHVQATLVSSANMYRHGHFQRTLAGRVGAGHRRGPAHRCRAGARFSCRRRATSAFIITAPPTKRNSLRDESQSRPRAIRHRRRRRPARCRGLARRSWSARRRVRPSGRADQQCLDLLSDAARPDHARHSGTT